MTIKDYYDTLLRRGMPKHPDIFNAGSYLAHSACEHDGRNGCLSHSDTRDLLTMHALRWALGSLDSESARNAVHLDVFSDGSCAVERGDETLGESDTDILEAILAATAHLPQC